MATPRRIDDHAPFAPSSASIWLECPYSVQLAIELDQAGKLIRKPPGHRALLGRLIHEYGEAAVRRFCHHGGNYTAWLSQFRPSIIEFLRAAKPRTPMSEIEDWATAVLAAVEVWVRAASLFASQINPIEHRLVCPEFPVVVESEWLQGTADLVIAPLPPSRLKHLIVLDLKTGRVPVEVRDNPQLLLYAAGAAASLRDCLVDVQPDWRLTIGIVQPTLTLDDRYPPTHPLCHTVAYDTTVAAALAVARKARKLVAEVRHDRCVPTPGGHCRFCRVQAQCPGYTKDVLSVFSAQPLRSKSPDQQRVAVGP